MADVMDDAQKYNDLYQQVAFQNQRNKSVEEIDGRFNGANCVDCEIKIPRARLRMHKIRCVDCQSDKETHDKLYAQ